MANWKSKFVANNQLLSQIIRFFHKVRYFRLGKSELHLYILNSANFSVMQIFEPENSNKKLSSVLILFEHLPVRKPRKLRKVIEFFHKKRILKFFVLFYCFLTV